MSERRARRIPLWLTVVPLVAGGAVYWHFWSEWKERFRTDINAVLEGETAFGSTPYRLEAIGGFPYRLEADVTHPVYELGGVHDEARPGDGPVGFVFRADRARLNRTPWQRDLTIIRAERPIFVANVKSLAGADIFGGAETSVTSLHLSPTGIARLSTVFTKLDARTALFATRIIAPNVEVHLRETRARSNEAWSATPPQQAQVVLAGKNVRFGAGAALSLDLDAGITATARLTSYAAWADGGTVEIRSAVLADTTGEVARLAASIVPTANTLRLTGTVTTVCPASVRAAVDGAPPPPHELRRRNPVRLAFGGTPGFFVLAALPNDAPSAVRGQLPPCPRFD